MSWIPIARTPITMVPTSERQARRFFRGKPHALAFLASGMLVVGESHGLTLHDPEVESDEPALLDVGGGVRWMVAHTDGSSVIAAVSGPTGCAIVRAWPAERRVVTLHRTSSFGYGFSGACAPDGTQLCWLEASHPPTLHTLDATSGALVRSVELPPAMAPSPLARTARSTSRARTCSSFTPTAARSPATMARSSWRPRRCSSPGAGASSVQGARSSIAPVTPSSTGARRRCAHTWEPTLQTARG
jgi:hypothetical protein